MLWESCLEETSNLGTEVSCAAAVAPFVVVPTYDFHQFAFVAKHLREVGSKDRAVRIVDDVGRNERICGEEEEALHRAFCSRFDGCIDLFCSRFFAQVNCQVDDTTRWYGNSHGDTCELPVQFRNNQANSFGGTGRCRNNVLSTSASSVQIGVWHVLHALIVGVGVNGCHQARFDTEVIVQHFCNGSQAVGGTAGVGHTLVLGVELDQEVIARQLESQRNQGKTVADLGCGTGRALVPLVQQGFDGLAVDLSMKMLHIVQEKADVDDLPIECVQANLVEMDGLADESVDHAICLFSTLGMIQGRDNRRKALRHMSRILRPDGLLILHVHNFWFNLYDPGGIRWVLGSLLKSWTRKDHDAGDKFFNYRGVHNMFLHVFRRRELVSDLRQADFRIRQMVYLDATREGELSRKWFLGDLRANGWIVVCQK